MTFGKVKRGSGGVVQDSNGTSHSLYLLFSVFAHAVSYSDSDFHSLAWSSGTKKAWFPPTNPASATFPDKQGKGAGALARLIVNAPSLPSLNYGSVWGASCTHRKEDSEAFPWSANGLTWMLHCCHPSSGSALKSTLSCNITFHKPCGWGCFPLMHLVTCFSVLVHCLYRFRYHASWLLYPYHGYFWQWRINRSAVPWIISSFLRC